MSETFQTYGRRKRGRVLMRVPVEVCGTAQDGSVIEESTHTGVVGALGAMVRTSRLLQMGTDVVVTNRLSQQTAKFRVVWLGEQQADGFWEIGIESFLPLEDFWGVRFPPKPDQT